MSDSCHLYEKYVLHRNFCFILAVYIMSLGISNFRSLFIFQFHSESEPTLWAAKPLPYRVYSERPVHV